MFTFYGFCLCNPMCLKPLRLLLLELYGPIYTDFNRYDEKVERLNFLFLSSRECQFLACLCICEHKAEVHRALRLILCTCFSCLLFAFFFLWLVGDACARYSLYNLWSLKQVFKKACNVLRSPEGPLQN